MLFVATLFVALYFPFSEVHAHSFVLSLDGANGVQASGYGTRLTVRGQLHQNTGIMTDQEIAAGVVGPCGRIFGGDSFPPFVIDPQAELARAEASGIPTVKDDGSINMGVFVHVPDGSGPFECEYSSDGSLSSFEPMNITTQIEGYKGVNPTADNFVYPLTAAFFPNATCTGGQGKDTCVMRCRNPIGFGSCAAVKLGGSAKRFNPSLSGSANGTDNSTQSAPPSNNSTQSAPPPVNQTTDQNQSSADPANSTDSNTSIPSGANTTTTNNQTVPQAPPPHNASYNPRDPLPASNSSSRNVERRSEPEPRRRQFLHKKPLHYRGITLLRRPRN